MEARGGQTNFPDFHAFIGVPRTRGYLGRHLVGHVKVGAVDKPSEAVVKQVFIIVLLAEERKQVPNRLQIPHSPEMPNTNIATP